MQEREDKERGEGHPRGNRVAVSRQRHRHERERRKAGEQRGGKGKDEEDGVQQAEDERRAEGLHPDEQHARASRGEERNGTEETGQRQGKEGAKKKEREKATCVCVCESPWRHPSIDRSGSTATTAGPDVCVLSLSCTSNASRRTNTCDFPASYCTGRCVACRYGPALTAVCHAATIGAGTPRKRPAGGSAGGSVLGHSSERGAVRHGMGAGGAGGAGEVVAGGTSAPDGEGAEATASR